MRNLSLAPTQLAISYLRFTVASHDRQQTIPGQSGKRFTQSSQWPQIPGRPTFNESFFALRCDPFRLGGGRAGKRPALWLILVPLLPTGSRTRSGCLILVKEVLQQEPTSGFLFVFVGELRWNVGESLPQQCGRDVSLECSLDDLLRCHRVSFSERPH